MFWNFSRMLSRNSDEGSNERGTRDRGEKWGQLKLFDVTPVAALWSQIFQQVLLWGRFALKKRKRCKIIIFRTFPASTSTFPSSPSRKVKLFLRIEPFVLLDICQFSYYCKLSFGKDAVANQTPYMFIFDQLTLIGQLLNNSELVSFRTHLGLF